MVSPSIRAIFRLITKSNAVGNSTDGGLDRRPQRDEGRRVVGGVPAAVLTRRPRDPAGPAGLPAGPLSWPPFCTFF